MALTNPIEYTSRTFDSILQNINNDSELIDKPNWFKRLIAGVGDVISLWNNATANNLLLRTAFTRRNVQLLLELIDYFLTPHTTANGKLLFYIDGSATFPFTVGVDDLVGLTSGSTSVSSKRFESRSSVNVIAVSENFVPAAVNIGTDVITVTRDFITGEKVRFITTGTLPAPLTINTDYYVIRVSSTEIKISSTLLNALNGIEINITTQGTGTHTIALYSVAVQCYQQQSIDPVIIGKSDGVTEWQEFSLGDIDILRDTLSITINSLTWDRVDSFIDSLSTDRHYRLYYNSDNSAFLQFGNGTYGAVPPAFDIEAEYSVGGGVDSNVSGINQINIYAGSDSNIIGVSNVVSITGGSDVQTIEEAKILGPLLLKARDRFVTVEDGEALSLAFGGISQTKIIKNAFGVLSARVLNIANGGGTISTAEKSSLQSYLIDRTILESVDVRVEDPTITPVAVTSAAKMLNGYTWSSGVENWFRLAWKLFFSETGSEIVLDFISNGVDSARELINIIFSESYTSSDNDQIQNFLNSSIYSPRLIGEEPIQESDAFAFVAGLTFGVDYITISAPLFPLVISSDEITTDGVLTLTEIP